MSDAPPIAFPTSSGSAGDPAPTTRRAAFYRENSFQPFSRSAAKRQSIMDLGSIKHLQHQYIKFGLGSANVGPASARPSFGGAAMMEEPEELDEDPGADKGRRKSRIPLLAVSLGRVQGLRGEDAAELPPSPAKPEVDRRMPWEKDGETGRSVKDEKELRRDVLATLEDVCERYGPPPARIPRLGRTKGVYCRADFRAVRRWGLVTSLSYHPLRRRSSRSSYSEYDQQQRLPSPSPEPLPRSVSSLSTASDDDARPPSLVLELLQTTTAAIRNVQLYVVSLPTDAFAPRTTTPGSTTTPPSGSLAVFPTLPTTPPRPSSPFASADTTPTDPTPLHQLRQSSLAVLGALKTLEHRYRLPLSDPPISPASDSASPSASSSESAPHADGFEYTPATLDDLVDEARTVREYVEVVDRVLFRDRERRRGSIRAGEDSDGRKLGHRRSKKVEKKEDVILPVKSAEDDSLGEPVAGKVDLPSVVEPERDEDEVSESGSEDDLPQWALLDPGIGASLLLLF